MAIATRLADAGELSLGGTPVATCEVAPPWCCSQAATAAACTINREAATRWHFASWLLRPARLGRQLLSRQAAQLPVAMIAVRLLLRLRSATATADKCELNAALI